MAKIEMRIPDWVERIYVWPVMLYRRRKYGYPFRRINLGDGNWTILDQEDYFRLNGYRWFLTGDKGKFYAVRSIKISDVKTTLLSMHREIIDAPKGLLVDHRNTNSLDNRRSNLRFATQSQNSCNCKKREGCSSKFKGVSYRKDFGEKRWVAYIRGNGRRINLGTFLTESEAAKAYDEAAKKYHGEFATLNFT